jgi:hypothetical protein
MLYSTNITNTTITLKLKLKLILIQKLKQNIINNKIINIIHTIITLKK